MSQDEKLLEIERRLDDHDAILKEVRELLVYFKASRVGLNTIKWLATVGMGIATVWALFHQFPNK